MKKKVYILVTDPKNELKVDLLWFAEVDLGIPILFTEIDTAQGKRYGFTQKIKKWYQFWK